MPEAEAGRYLVWRLGQALLATPIENVVEAVPVSGGRVAGRPGALEVVRIAGLEAEGDVRTAVVVRSGDRTLALPADEVEGILTAAPRLLALPPAWIGPVARGRVDQLVRLVDDRIAAVVDLAGLAHE